VAVSLLSAYLLQANYPATFTTVPPHSAAAVAVAAVVVVLVVVLGVFCD
jgi:hypothetical protein